MRIASRGCAVSLCTPARHDATTRGSGTANPAPTNTPRLCRSHASGNPAHTEYLSRCGSGHIETPRRTALISPLPREGIVGVGPANASQPQMTATPVAELIDRPTCDRPPTRYTSGRPYCSCIVKTPHRGVSAGSRSSVITVVIHYSKSIQVVHAVDQTHIREPNRDGCMRAGRPRSWTGLHAPDAITLAPTPDTR